MSKFLEKKNSVELERLIQSLPCMQEISVGGMHNLTLFIKQEVETAYRAGMIHFDGNDNTCIPPEDLEVSVNSIRRKVWSSVTDFSIKGPVKEEYLVRAYLNSKGYD